MSDYKAPQGDKVKRVKFARFTLGKTVQNEKTAEDERLTLTWQLRGEYPRATVFTAGNIKDGEGHTDYNKMIIAPFDMLSLSLFLDYANEILDNKEKGSYREVNCLNNKWVNNERTNEVYVQAVVRFGIDTDGMAYMVVMADKKPKIKFPILPPESNGRKWIEFKEPNGDEITTPQKLSREYARVYIRTLQKLMDSELDSLKDVSFEDNPSAKRNYSGKSHYPSKANNSNYNEPKKSELVNTATATVEEDPLKDII